MDASSPRPDGEHPVPGIFPIRPHFPRPAAPVSLRLVLQPGGSAVEVTRAEVLIGRHSEADLRLPLPDVSRRHCRLQYEDGGWQVYDLHSLNGVYVNGEAVVQAALSAGDQLRIGGFTFAVEVGEEVAETDHGGHVRSILQTLSRPTEGRRKAG